MIFHQLLDNPKYIFLNEQPQSGKDLLHFEVDVNKASIMKDGATSEFDPPKICKNIIHQ